MSGSFEVIKPGALTTIQDLGRPGFAHIGIPRSGAADRDSLRLANRLVGNDEGAAGLECTLIGPSLRFDSDAVIALTGAPIASNVDGEQLPLNTALSISAGSLLKLGSASGGLRSYIAVAGGLDAEPVMGSRASDLLSGLGPDPLRAGDRVGFGDPTASAPPIGAAPVAAPQEQPLLHVLPGPRADWFAEGALELLAATAWEVSSESNRSGVRLAGGELPRARSDELFSEGMVEGAIQVPASGRPIILLADHPTTGGYPVIAVLRSDDLGAAAQLRPGQGLRFAVS